MSDEADEQAIGRIMELRKKKLDELAEHVREFGKKFAVDPRDVVVQLAERFKTKRLVSIDQHKS